MPALSAEMLPVVDWRTRLSLAVTLALAYLIVSNGLLFFAGGPQTALLLGATAALCSPRTRDAVGISAGVAFVMTMLSPPRLVFDQGGPVVLLQITLLTALVAWAVRGLRDKWPIHDRRICVAVAAGLVVLLLINFWVPLLVGGITPLVGYGPLSANILRPVPQSGQYLLDDELYRRFFYLLHQGQGHYEAFRDAWLGQRIRGELPFTPTAYRLPTYYWLWRALPADAFLVVPVFLSFVSVGAIAAAFSCAALGGVAWGGVALAPLASAAVLAYGMGVGMSVYVTYVDLPAASIALCGIAMILHAHRTQSTRTLWMGVAVLTLAALTREILAYLLMVGAVSAWWGARTSAALAESSPQSAVMGGGYTRALRPWLAGLLVFGAGYGLHVWQVTVHIPERLGRLNYSQGGPSFALRAISLFADVFSGTLLLLTLLFILGVVGIWRATAAAGEPALRESRLFLMGAVLAPLGGMLLVGNPGRDLYGGLVNYWGLLFVPIALAVWPLALRSRAQAS